MGSLQHATELEMDTCWCGISHAIPKSLKEQQRRQHREGRTQTSIYCPLGHGYIIAGEGETKKLERQLARERAAHDQTKAALRDTEARRRATLGAKTKLAKRVASGVCPCCKRTFQQLARHVKTQHPEWAGAETRADA